jgi:glucokinase
MILAGDIGGTKTVLGLFASTGGRVEERASTEFPSRDFPGLEPILEQFLAQPALAALRPEIVAAGFGAAGPVHQGQVRTTNLPWVIDAARLEAGLGMPVVLMNDLEAMAHGIAGLAGSDFETLQDGVPSPEGNAALIAAGTGLGEAILYRHGGRLVPSPSEGGHADFAARNDEEIGLLRFLNRRYGRAGYEQVLSGPGLVNCYRFTHETGDAPHPDLLSTPDPAAAITTAALESRCEQCRRSLDLFVAIYGAEAGNLALTVLATSGVYVGGGIAPKILPALRDGRFITAFRHKGEAFAAFMAAVPVKVILNPRCPLLGAAMAAAELPA